MSRGGGSAQGEGEGEGQRCACGRRSKGVGDCWVTVVVKTITHPATGTNHWVRGGGFVCECHTCLYPVLRPLQLPL